MNSIEYKVIVTFEDDVPQGYWTDTAQYIAELLDSNLVPKGIRRAVVSYGDLLDDEQVEEDLEGYAIYK